MNKPEPLARAIRTLKEATVKERVELLKSPAGGGNSVAYCLLSSDKTPRKEEDVRLQLIPLAFEDMTPELKQEAMDASVFDHSGESRVYSGWWGLRRQSQKDVLDFIIDGMTPQQRFESFEKSRFIDGLVDRVKKGDAVASEMMESALKDIPPLKRLKLQTDIVSTPISKTKEDGSTFSIKFTNYGKDEHIRKQTFPEPDSNTDRLYVKSYTRTQKPDGSYKELIECEKNAKIQEPNLEKGR